MTGRVVRATSLVLLVVAGALIVTAGVAMWFAEPVWPFLVPSLGLFTVCWFPVLRSTPDFPDLSPQESYAVVTITWTAMCIVGAIPFLLTGATPSVADALFESTSGFTTTGSSIFSDVESLAKSLLFWRSMTHWLGGMGIVVLAVALLELFGVGGFLLMQGEAPGLEVERLTSRISQTARILWAIYLGMTVLQTMLYLFGGLTLFDAVTHTFGTLATGGFSTRNGSIASFESNYVEWVTTVFMVLSGINFVLYSRLFTGDFLRVRKDSELKAFVGLYITAVFLAVLAIRHQPGYERLGDAIRDGAFQVATLMTSTGYATADYVLWPGLARGVLLLMLFIGGCAGSTSGGIKMVHVVLTAKSVRREVRRVRHPNSVFSVFLNGRPVRERTVVAALNFVAAYVGLVLVSTLVVASAGTTLETALSASLAVIGNIGPGFDAVGPTGNFAFLPAWTKTWLSTLMIIGRLEIITVFAFLRVFDRHAPS